MRAFLSLVTHHSCSDTYNNIVLSQLFITVSPYPIELKKFFQLILARSSMEFIYASK